ncbi:hypothetical protein OF855_24545 [Mycolicibacterium fortuitum]|uniref:hypothetical protein n=1 Tax=Mycolicibacterium fortuitum TaxID=1766 RepID=UPI0022BA56FD|nr:hypothetical protein [Mycolicibacterium fortuitum]WAY18410.1 hypothetical protein OF855_24545 [Mycolicibacterium fortuitum]
MNRADADLFASAFNAGALYHPGDDTTPSRPIPIPGFRATGMSDDQATEMIGQAAKLWGEALAHFVETHGKTIIDTTELAQLRAQAADAPDGTRIIQVATTPTSAPVLELPVKKTDDRVIVPATVLKKVADNL